MRYLRLAATLPATALAISLLSGGAASATVADGAAQARKDLRKLEVSFNGRIGA
jgi:hypothetical protein